MNKLSLTHTLPSALSLPRPNIRRQSGRFERVVAHGEISDVKIEHEWPDWTLEED